MHEWAIVNWKGFAVETGKPTIKKDKYSDGPAAFQVGTYKVSKCWEIAVQQMRSGEKATVTCPGELVDQSIDKTDDVYGKDLGRKFRGKKLFILASFNSSYPMGFENTFEQICEYMGMEYLGTSFIYSGTENLEFLINNISQVEKAKLMLNIDQYP